jgi:hypothetical protein
MSPGLRRFTYWVFAVLWASGCLWLVVHYFGESTTNFGPVPNPWEPTLLRVHGWLAAAGVFLLGWISSQHIVDRWELWKRRPSGPLLGAAAILLVLSGYALYYTGDGFHDLSAGVHEVLGTAAIFLALLHWRRSGPRPGP